MGGGRERQGRGDGDSSEQECKKCISSSEHKRSNVCSKESNVCIKRSNVGTESLSLKALTRQYSKHSSYSILLL